MSDEDDMALPTRLVQRAADAVGAAADIVEAVAASYLFIVGEIAPLRPRDDAMPLPESVKAVA